MRHDTTEMWALRRNRPGGPGSFVHDGRLPCLFRTRNEARDYADRNFDYLRARPIPRRVTVLVSDYGD